MLKGGEAAPMTDRKTEPLSTAYALRLANSWARGGVCSMREGDAQRYHAACAAALHEKLEREEKAAPDEHPQVKHGNWEKVIPSKSAAKRYRKLSCSVCHRAGHERYNFCPNCGAKMDGGNDHE